MPLVSVIIPTYNRSTLLQRAVTSVLSQTFSDYELIIIDDASTDNNNECLPSYLQHGKIRYYRLAYHCGVSHARNFGASNARGTWLAFLDSDDEWFPQKLQKQINWHLNNPDYRISQTKEIWIRNGVRVNPPKTHEKKQGNIFSESLERCMITPSSVILRKDLFWEFGGFKQSLPACEDYDLWLWITSKFPVGLIDEFLLTRYGGHNDQLSATVMGLDRFRIRSLMDILLSNTLIKEQETMARMLLVKKSRIFADGCKKRGKLIEYERYANIAELFS